MFLLADPCLVRAGCNFEQVLVLGPHRGNAAEEDAGPAGEGGFLNLLIDKA